jgi:hypothetical protein
MRTLLRCGGSNTSSYDPSSRGRLAGESHRPVRLQRAANDAPWLTADDDVRASAAILPA